MGNTVFIIPKMQVFLFRNKKLKKKKNTDIIKHY